MYDAHERGDVDAVRKLLDAHPELEEMGPDDDMQTWLHVAAEKGHIPVAEFWLGRGYDVNLNLRGFSPEKDGLNTPLHFAKDAAMTRYLLSRGASVNACERVVGTPLHNAIIRAVEPSQKGRRRPNGANMDQIRALLEAGADLALMNGEGKGFTPLAWAIALRRKTAEQLLREVGAPEKGRSPFARRGSGSRNRTQTPPGPRARAWCSGAARSPRSRPARSGPPTTRRMPVERSACPRFIGTSEPRLQREKVGSPYPLITSSRRGLGVQV